MATAKVAPEARKRAERTPAPKIDFGTIEAKPAATPVTQDRGGSLDNTPIPQWLKESWERRTDGVGAAVELSARPNAEVKYLKQLMIRCMQQGDKYGLQGVGVRFQITPAGEGTSVLKFQTRTRKARAAKK